MKQSELQKQLFKLQDEKYGQFHQSLCPGTDNIIGIRVPVLERLSKKIYKEEDWKLILEIKPKYYEEKLLQAMLIGLNKKDSIETIQEHIKKFIPEIDNWAICDGFCTRLKITKKYPKEMWEFLEEYLDSKKEFELRFAIVMLLNYYIEKQYLDTIFEIVDNIEHDGYYVKMAIAWLISICYIKYPKETLKYLNNNSLEKWTYNKAIQKIIESYRVTIEEKELLIKLKRK